MEARDATGARARMEAGVHETQISDDVSDVTGIWDKEVRWRSDGVRRKMRREREGEKEQSVKKKTELREERAWRV